MKNLSLGGTPPCEKCSEKKDNSCDLTMWGVRPWGEMRKRAIRGGPADMKKTSLGKDPHLAQEGRRSAHPEKKMTRLPAARWKEAQWLEREKIGQSLAK